MSLKAVVFYLLFFAMPSLLECASEVTRLAEKLMPAVVTVYTEDALGSGFIIDEEGHILTNAHVVSKLWSRESEIDDPSFAFKERVAVILQNKNRYPAEVLGYDVRSDIALLKITSDEKIKPLKLGDSDSVKSGQQIIALGSPLGLEETATVGVVSHVGRALSAGPGWEFPINVIQTDAAINPGNSGGPMVNIKGEVIGINYASTAKWTSEGVGFAVPINVAKFVKDEVLSRKKVVYGYLGLGLRAMSREYADAFKVEEGILIEHIDNLSPARKANLKPGDIIVSFNGKKVSARDEKEVNDFIWLINTTPPGKEVFLEVLRRNNEGVWEEVVFKPVVEASPATEIELKPYLYEDIGFTLKDITIPVSLKYRLSAEEGLWISDISKNSIQEAGFAVGDVIARVGETEIKTNDDFRDAILENLKRKEKSLKIVVKRGRVEIPCFLKMDYPLDGKTVAAVFLSKKFPEKFYRILELKLAYYGANLNVASFGEEIILTGEKEVSLAGLKLSDIKMNECDGIVFLSEGEVAYGGEEILKAFPEITSADKVIASVGGAVPLLIEAVPSLKEKKFTADEKYLKKITALGGHITGSSAEADENFITATGKKDSFRPFSHLLIKQLLNSR